MKRMKREGKIPVVLLEYNRKAIWVSNDQGIVLLIQTDGNVNLHPNTWIAKRLCDIRVKGDIDILAPVPEIKKLTKAQREAYRSPLPKGTGLLTGVPTASRESFR